MASQLSAAMNSSMKELRNEINVKIHLDADEWILKSKSWLGVYYRKVLTQYLENPAITWKT